MSFQLSKKTVSIAVALAFGSIATSTIAADQPLHIVNWHGSVLPNIESEYLITKEDADKYANNNSWFAVVDANQNASGTINNFNMSVKTEGTESQKQFMAIDVEDGDIEFGGSTFNLSVETGFKGTGNNQATAVLVENGSSFTLSAGTSNINVTSTNIDGKSVYGLATQGKDSLISVTGKETNIVLKKTRCEYIYNILINLLYGRSK